jgi:hypothetical protein
MKKFLVILFITISLSGLLVPAVSYAAQQTSSGLADPSSSIKVLEPNSTNILPSAVGPANASVVNTPVATGSYQALTDAVAKTTAARTAATNAHLAYDLQHTPANLKLAEDADAAYVAAQKEEDAARTAESAARTATSATSAKSSCGWFESLSGACIMEKLIYSLIDFIGNAILSLAAWILWACGIILNLSIISFVIKMKDTISHIPAIYVVWQTVRDLANMCFIFILLAIAIQTILQVGDYRKMLRNVILVALFINFSFFFTSVMIDASNIVAVQFYNGFAGGVCKGIDKADGCMSQKVVSSLKLSTIYNASAPDTTTGTASTKTIALSSEQGVGAFLITVILGSALMVVAGGIFIASAILVFYRFVELIMVLMFSPIAFAAIILPATQKFWNKWWDKLITQLVFAPAYFMFLWVTMKVIQSKVVPSDGSFAQGFAGNGTTLFGLIASYIITIMMLIYSLTLAKELGASGVDMATKASKSFQGFVGRNTVGRASSRIANSQLMQRTVATMPFAGRLAQKAFDYGAGQSFGGRKGGFAKAEKDSIKDAVAQAKRMGPSPIMIENARKVRENLKNNPNDEKAKKAAEEADRIMGVDKEEATKRAGKDKERRIEKETEDIMKKNPGIKEEEATKQAESKVGKEIEKETEDIMKKNPGIAKARQEKFANMLAFDYGAAIASPVKTLKNVASKVSDTKIASGISAASSKIAYGASKALNSELGKKIIDNNTRDMVKDVVRGVKRAAKGAGGAMEGLDYAASMPIGKMASGAAKEFLGEKIGTKISNVASKIDVLGVGKASLKSTVSSTVRGTVNVVTDHTTRVAKAGAVRKDVIKPKTPMEKLLDAYEKDSENKEKGGGISDADKDNLKKQGDGAKT